MEEEEPSGLTDVQLTQRLAKLKKQINSEQTLNKVPLSEQALEALRKKRADLLAEQARRGSAVGRRKQSKQAVVRIEKTVEASTLVMIAHGEQKSTEVMRCVESSAAAAVHEINSNSNANHAEVMAALSDIRNQRSSSSTDGLPTTQEGCDIAFVHLRNHKKRLGEQEREDKRKQRKAEAEKEKEQKQQQEQARIEEELRKLDEPQPGPGDTVLRGIVLRRSQNLERYLQDLSNRDVSHPLEVAGLLCRLIAILPAAECLVELRNVQQVFFLAILPPNAWANLQIFLKTGMPVDGPCIDTDKKKSKITNGAGRTVPIATVARVRVSLIGVYNKVIQQLPLLEQESAISPPALEKAVMEPDSFVEPRATEPTVSEVPPTFVPDSVMEKPCTVVEEPDSLVEPRATTEEAFVPDSVMEKPCTVVEEPDSLVEPRATTEEAFVPDSVMEEPCTVVEEPDSLVEPRATEPTEEAFVPDSVMEEPCAVVEEPEVLEEPCSERRATADPQVFTQEPDPLVEPRATEPVPDSVLPWNIVEGRWFRASRVADGLQESMITEEALGANWDVRMEEEDFGGGGLRRARPSRGARPGV